MIGALENVGLVPSKELSGDTLLNTTSAPGAKRLKRSIDVEAEFFEERSLLLFQHAT